MFDPFTPPPLPPNATTRRALRRRRTRRRRVASPTSSRSVSLVVATLLAGGLATAGFVDPWETSSSPAKATTFPAAPPSRPGAPARITAAAAAEGEVAAAAVPAPQPPEPPEPTTGPAYRVVSADGGVFTHGWYGYSGSAAGLTASPVTGVAQTPDGDGYWLSSADGGVFSFGSAPFLGSAPGLSAAPIVDIAATPSGAGYWLVTSTGGVFTFGDAVFAGAAVDLRLNKAVTSLAATPSGRGYWMVTADGGVLSFGDAPFWGSIADRPLNAGVLDLVPTRSGNGYYLVSTDGGVFSFGDAPYLGSAADRPLNRPIVDMSLTAAGDGYWLVAQDGGVFTFGAAAFLGIPSPLSAPVVGIAAGDGHEKPAPAAELVAAASAPPAPAAPVAPSPPAAAAGAFGWDISYPQCGGSFPDGDFSFAVVGINGGRAFRQNRCLADQWRWASSRAAAGVYANINFPRTNEELAHGASSVRQPACGGHLSCIAYNFGWNALNDAVDYAHSQGVDAPFVWLDVEQLNYWTPDPALNAVVLRGAIDALRDRGLGAGVYSTPYQYNRITGGEVTGLPVWSAGALGFDNANRYCSERAFGGGAVAFVQLVPERFDANIGCPGAGPLATYFRMP